MRGAIAGAVDEVWSHFGRADGLISGLPADAVWVRARGGEFMACVPRLMELWSIRELEPGVEPHILLEHVALAREDLTSNQARAIEVLADTLWMAALTSDPAEVSAEQLLGELVHLRLPMVRWLDPWLSSLDGVGARQLAEAILRPTNTAAWQAAEDERQQLEAWAASEPVVMGLTMVGGVHLNSGDLSRLYDKLI